MDEQQIIWPQFTKEQEQGILERIKVEELKRPSRRREYVHCAVEAGLTPDEAECLFDRFDGDTLPIPVGTINLSTGETRESWELAGGCDECTSSGPLTLEEVRKMVTASDKECIKIYDAAFARYQRERDYERQLQTPNEA